MKSSTSKPPTSHIKRPLSSDQVPFDALQNFRPLPLVKCNLSAITDALVIDLFADLWPLPPSSYQDKDWDVGKQIRAGGFSLENFKINCIRAAYTWM